MLRPVTDFDNLARWQSPSHLNPRQAARQAVANPEDRVTLDSLAIVKQSVVGPGLRLQTPIQEVVAPNPIEVNQEVQDPSRRLCRGVVQLRQAVRPEIWRASPSTQQLLSQDATLIGTLCGASLLAPLPLDRQQGKLSPEGWNQLADFQVLSRNLNLMGSQKFAVMEDPAQAGQWLLANKSALCQALERTDLGEFPLEDLETGELRSLLQSNAPTREFAEEIGRLSQLANARALVYLQQAQAMPPLSDSPQEVKAVGLISYLSSPEQLSKLQATLQEWDQNFADFGHSGRTLRICDDSPPPYADQLKAYAAGFQSQSNLKLEVLGRAEKEQRRQHLIEGLLHSPRAQQLGLDRAQLDEMTLQMFGGMSPQGQWTSGPTQNRNLSMLLLQGQRAFQADHDMQPRVLTTAGECERHEFLEVHNPPPDIKGIALALRDVDDDTDHYATQGAWESLPVDLLAQMSAVPGDRIASPQFCGSGDPPISQVVSGSLRQPCDFGKHQDEIFKETLFFGDSGGRRTASPMVLPAAYDVDKLLPFAPPIRDGDLMPGLLMETFSGIRPRELPRAILHTETAGSKWGGEANLLSDSALSEAVMTVLQESLVGGSPAESANAILARLEQPQAMENPVRNKLSGYQSLANRYTQNRRDRALTLQELTTQLGSPEDSQKAAQSWRTDCTAAQALMEVGTALQRCQSEATEMESVFPPKDSDVEFPQLQLLTSKARGALNSFALALKLRQEILEWAQA